jgi:hypothetical protein
MRIESWRATTAPASAAADSGKTRHANQGETQARLAAHTRAEGGRLHAVVGRLSSEPYTYYLDSKPDTLRGLLLKGCYA